MHYRREFSCDWLVKNFYDETPTSKFRFWGLLTLSGELHIPGLRKECSEPLGSISLHCLLAPTCSCLWHRSRKAAEMPGTSWFQWSGQEQFDGMHCGLWAWISCPDAVLPPNPEVFEVCAGKRCRKGRKTYLEQSASAAHQNHSTEMWTQRPILPVVCTAMLCTNAHKEKHLMPD